MTAPTDQLTDITKRSQEAVTTAVRNWTDAVQSLSGNQPALPDARQLVDTYFDFAEKALSMQREAVSAGRLRRREGHRGRQGPGLEGHRAGLTLFLSQRPRPRPDSAGRGRGMSGDGRHTARNARCAASLNKTNRTTSTPVPGGAHRLDGDPGAVVHRPAVDAGRDRREGDRRGAQLVGDPQRLPVAGGQQRRSGPRARDHTGPTVWITQRASSRPAVVATAWPVGRPVAVVGGAQLAAVGEDLRAAAPVDRAVDPAAAEQRGVRGVDDRVVGVTGFGGPPAHISLLRDLMVERKRWMDAQAFEDANAACGLLPGPASTQLATFCAYRVAGPAGAIVGGLGFIVPAVVLILALSVLFLGQAPPLWVQGAGAGAGAAVAAVAVHAARGLIGPSYKRVRKNRARAARWLAYVAVGTAAAALIGAYLVLALLACGLVELALDGKIRPPRRTGQGLLGVLVPASISAGGIGALAWTAFKVGALSFGGGFVIIPLMQPDAVHTYHWMTNSQFLNAVALGQITPGPVVATVAAVGYAAHGLAGGALAAAVAFAPSFSFILLGGSRFERSSQERQCPGVPQRCRPGGHRRHHRRRDLTCRRADRGLAVRDSRRRRDRSPRTQARRRANAARRRDPRRDRRTHRRAPSPDRPTDLPCTDQR